MEISNHSLRRPPPLPSKPEYKAPLRERCADGLLITEVTSPRSPRTQDGHTRDSRVATHGCHLPYTKDYSHDTRAPGGAAAAAARAGGRIRTGRSSDRLGGRCSVCGRARRLRSSSAVRCTGKRGGAGTRGGGGVLRTSVPIPPLTEDPGVVDVFVT